MQALQRRRVRCDVGPGFVNDADHAQRHPHPADFHAIGAFAHFADFAHRVGERGHLLHARGHRLDRLGAERQPVDERCVTAGGACSRHILCIGREQRRAAGPQCRGNRGECPILRRAVGAGEQARCRSRTTAEILHVGRNIGDARGSGSRRLVHALDSTTFSSRASRAARAGGRGRRRDSRGARRAIVPDREARPRRRPWLRLLTRAQCVPCE